MKRGEKRRKKTAATRAELEAMLAMCDDSLVGIRDRALLLFVLASGGRRRSEIAVVEMASLQRVGAQQVGDMTVPEAKRLRELETENSQQPIARACAVAPASLMRQCEQIRRS
ncbi:hypothetical protein [Pseudolysobacter antarcticus]|uniref:hypothetical protein n=1 Tax=Pseudolysobacter antarcticus TaxID=2511995 RepID=UPI001A9338B0